jgi:hypothetical protein
MLQVDVSKRANIKFIKEHPWCVRGGSTKVVECTIVSTHPQRNDGGLELSTPPSLSTSSTQ